MMHELKTWPEPYAAVALGIKNYEIRKNDRHFEVADLVWLREWCPFSKEYSGRSMRFEILYMTVGGEWGIPSGLCILGIGRGHRMVEQEPKSNPRTNPRTTAPR